jgi:hypothetical protein
METQPQKKSESEPPHIAHLLLRMRRTYAAYGRALAPNGLADVVHDGEYVIPADVLDKIVAATPAYESIWGHTSHIPSTALHLIAKLAEGSAYQEVLDPCGGPGLLLSSMIEAGVGRRGTGVIENPIDQMLARAISADLPIQWVLSRSADWLGTCSQVFDLVICGFPFGVATETVRLTDINGETVKLTDERGRLVLLQAALRLTAHGVGVFIVPNLDARGPATGVYHNLHRFGLAVDAYFALAESPNIPISKASSGVVVIRRATNEDVFVECPANLVPVEVRQTGMRGAWYVTRKEVCGGTDREFVAAD